MEVGARGGATLATSLSDTAVPAGIGTSTSFEMDCGLPPPAGGDEIWAGRAETVAYNVKLVFNGALTVSAIPRAEP